MSSVITNRFDDGLPNYRQEKIYRREQAIIPRSTQCDWIISSAWTLHSLYNLLKEQVLCSKVVKTDDSELEVQDLMHKKNMRKGKLTVYVGDDQHRATVFEFSENKSFEKNKLFFQHFSGFVQADEANGFDALFQDGSKIEVGCNAHARRKFFDALPGNTKVCGKILDLFGSLYALEEKIRNTNSAHRLAVRQTKSKPLTKKLRKILRALEGTLIPTDPLADAVAYALKHWIALTRFLGHPELEIDNNASERAIKDFVLMRKNSLFAGSDEGGRAADVHLSIMASCKRNKIDPIAYLTDVFSRINTMKTSEIEQLLPDRWRPVARSLSS